MTNALRELQQLGAWIAGAPNPDQPFLLGRNVLPSGDLMGLSRAQLLDVNGETVLAYGAPDVGNDAHSPTGFLGAFMQIETAEDVLRFARKYGPLELCREGLPFFYDYRPSSLTHDHNACGSWHADTVRGFRVEPVGIWLRLAKRAEAMVRLSYYVQSDSLDEPNADQLLDVITAAFPSATAAQLAKVLTGEKPVPWFGWGRPPTSDEKSIIRGFLQAQVDNFFSYWQVRPWFWWPDGVLVGMFTREFIPLQLAGVLSEKHRQAVCSGCHRAYLREKRSAPAGPRRSRNYCPRCKAAGVDNRHRQQAKRDRDRHQLTADQGGV